MNDLFGNEVTLEQERKIVGRPKGYAYPPGTGPAGETCRTCKNAVYHQMSKRYWKCLLLRAVWTSGPGTDIRLKSPACKMWEAKPAKA